MMMLLRRPEKVCTKLGMDKNKDGKVSKEEFVGACLEQQEISKMLALKIVDIFVEEEGGNE